MNIRRPSLMLRVATAGSALMGLLGGVLGGRGVTIAANKGTGVYEGPRGPRPAPKSYIRGRGPAWAGRPIWSGKEICDARNHPKGKIYSDLDRRFMAQAEAKRDRKRIKRMRDAEAQRHTNALYGFRRFCWAA